MASTGILGIAFVFVHMAGNLLMFKPAGAPAAMRAYAAALRDYGPLLWIARVGLVGIVMLHIVAAVQLTRRNRRARPIPYAVREPQVSTWGARSMRFGGFLLVAFIVFHLGDMTWGTWHPQFTHLDPYNNLRLGFRRWWAVVFYLAAIVALVLHLYHGAWAAWRTLGARRRSERPLHRSVAVVLSVLIGVGFAAVPLAAALGLFRPEAAAPAATAGLAPDSIPPPAPADPTVPGTP
jgi:succinate dehydrogenase / fumarate reductase cytochrome b subunit